MNKQQEPRLRFKGFTGAWEEKRLSDVVEIVGGGTPDTNNSAYWGGEIDWYSPTEIGENVYANGSIRKITLLGLQKSSAVILPADRTVLFTSRASIGDMAILTKQGATNQGFQSFIVREGLNIYFLYTMGFKIKEYALKNASGSTFLEISKTQLLQMESLFPSLPEQTHLGLFFRRLDSQIAESRAVLEKSRQLKKAMLAKMFPANGEKIPKIRFKGFEGEWECRKLGDVVEIVGGYAFKSAEFGSGNMAIIRISNILPNGSIGGDFVYFGEDENLEKFKANKNDYLIAMSGATTGKIGQVRHEAYINQRVGLFRQNENSNNDFIGSLLQKEEFLTYLMENWGAGAQPNISIKQIENYNTYFPNLKEQTAIGLFFRQLDETIALQSAEIEKLNQLKKGLLAAMLV